MCLSGSSFDFRVWVGILVRTYMSSLTFVSAHISRIPVILEIYSDLLSHNQQHSYTLITANAGGLFAKLYGLVQKVCFVGRIFNVIVRV